MSNNIEKQIYFGSKDEVKESVKLADLVQINSEKNKTNLDLEILTVSAKDGLIKQSVYYNGNTTMTASDKKNYVILKKGDFSYNKSYSKAAPWGACKMLTLESGLISSAYFNFRFKKQAYNEYFQYYFESSTWHKNIFKIAQEGARNHGMLNMSKEDFFSIKMNNVSDNIRLKTASILSQIDNLIIRQKKEINNYRDLKITLVNHLFTFEPYDKMIKLLSIGTIITGKTPSTKNIEAWTGEIPFITPTDMHLKKYISTSRHVSQTHISEKILLPPDSICFTCIASIGKMCMTSELSITNQQINSIILNKTYNSHYVYYQLQWMKRKIKSMVNSDGMAMINKAEFSEITIQKRSLHVQEYMANILSQMDKLIEIEEKKLEQLEKMKKYHLQQFFN